MYILRFHELNAIGNLADNIFNMDDCKVVEQASTALLRTHLLPNVSTVLFRILFLRLAKVSFTSTLVLSFPTLSSNAQCKFCCQIFQRADQINASSSSLTFVSSSVYFAQKHQINMKALFTAFKEPGDIYSWFGSLFLGCVTSAKVRLKVLKHHASYHYRLLEDYLYATITFTKNMYQLGVKDDYSVRSPQVVPQK